MTLRSLLLPLTPLYSAAVRTRSLAYRKGWCRSIRLHRPVVSVGNLTFGGTGKTPTVIALVRDLVHRGLHPAVLTRGYGRSAAATSPLVVVGPEPRLGPELTGDEPLELARRLPGVPIVVDADRARGGTEAIIRGADLLILDDGFQHLRLERDLDLVLIDAGDPWGGGHLPPLGRLREPLAALRRASAVLITKLPAGACSLPGALTRRLQQLAPGLPVLASVLRASRLRTPDGPGLPELLRGRRVLAFAGIGRPAGFVQLLRETGAEVVRTCWFEDHHVYREDEVQRLLCTAGELGALPVTTAKDAVKLPADTPVWVVEADVAPLDGTWDRLWHLLPAVTVAAGR